MIVKGLKFKVAPNLIYRIFLNFAIRFDNITNFHRAAFELYHTVAMVTYCDTKMITTCSPMIGQFFGTMIVASSDKVWL